MKEKERLDKKYSSYDQWLIAHSNIALIGKWFWLEAPRKIKYFVGGLILGDGGSHKQAATLSIEESLNYLLDLAKNKDLPRRKIREEIKKLTRNGVDDINWQAEKANIG